MKKCRNLDNFIAPFLHSFDPCVDVGKRWLGRFSSQKKLCAQKCQKLFARTDNKFRADLNTNNNISHSIILKTFPILFCWNCIYKQSWRCTYLDGERTMLSKLFFINGLLMTFTRATTTTMPCTMGMCVCFRERKRKSVRVFSSFFLCATFSSPDRRTAPVFMNESNDVTLHRPPTLYIYLFYFTLLLTYLLTY